MKHVKHGKGRTGPGGIKCACCTKGQSRDVKRHTARYNRRTGKRTIMSLWNDGYSAAFIQDMIAMGKVEV